MKASKIIYNIETIIIHGDLEKEITNISYDSRLIKPDGLFVAIRGYKVDGHNFIDNAIINGAKVIIGEECISSYHTGVTFIKVKDSRIALSRISANFFELPTTQLKLIAITGTNGKTSTSYILGQMLQYFGLNVGIIGTSGVKINGEILKNINKTTPTTPESLDIQSIAHSMLKHGVKVIIIEASSMALKLNRLLDCDIDIGIFTNISNEHLDDHGTFVDYINSKSLLFKLAKESIINLDDPNSSIMLKSAVHPFTYGTIEGSDLLISNILLDEGGSKFEVNTGKSKKFCYLPLPGLFSIYNVSAAIAVCLKLGFKLDLIVSSLEDIKPVTGRIENIQNSLNVKIIVDYAHTPNALKNVLDTLKVVTKNRLIVVFGCGGNRDKSKRPEMGKISSSIADYVIITSDNPRNENPSTIAEEIVFGIEKNNFEIILDRKLAIFKSLSLVTEGDTLVVAGKGDEDYQIINEIKYPFNDKNIILEYLMK